MDKNVNVKYKKYSDGVEFIVLIIKFKYNEAYIGMFSLPSPFILRCNLEHRKATYISFNIIGVQASLLCIGLHFFFTE